MPLAALELNDHSLLIQADDGNLHAEPGFARITGAGIVTGEGARAAAWREPQNVHDQYWCHLNEAPLAARQRWARHHADIAFAQLGSLWRNAGMPDCLIILAPGSFTDSQLSLLLGMLKALPASPLAVVDSALAACFEARQDTLFIDLQLHQCVVTLCRAEPRALSVADQEVLPDIGILPIYNAVARMVSDLLIDSYRYDPLHASDTEQAIYDRIPAWLMRLRWDEELSDTVQSDKGSLPLILRREAVRDRIASRLLSLNSFLDRHPRTPVVLSHGSSVLASVAARFADAGVFAQTAATELCLAHHPQIIGQQDGLVRVRHLRREVPAALAAEPEQPLATHLLFRDQALSLSRPVSLRIADGHLQLLDRFDQESVLTVVLSNGALQAVRASADVEAELPKTGRAGETLRVAGHELRLIKVI